MSKRKRKEKRQKDATLSTGVFAVLDDFAQTGGVPRQPPLVGPVVALAERTADQRQRVLGLFDSFRRLRAEAEDVALVEAGPGELLEHPPDDLLLARPGVDGGQVRAMEHHLGLYQTVSRLGGAAGDPREVGILCTRRLTPNADVPVLPSFGFLLPLHVLGQLGKEVVGQLSGSRLRLVQFPLTEQVLLVPPPRLVLQDTVLLWSKLLLFLVAQLDLRHVAELDLVGELGQVRGVPQPQHAVGVVAAAVLALDAVPEVLDAEHLADLRHGRVKLGLEVPRRDVRVLHHLSPPLLP